MFAFLDGYLKNQTEPPPKRVIRYYTLGERSWHTTTTWPPPGLTTQRWFFGANGSLARTQPSDADGADRYAVDFAATSGPLNRWHTQAGSDVVYPNRAAADKKLLTYTSAPLARARAAAALGEELESGVAAQPEAVEDLPSTVRVRPRDSGGGPAAGWVDVRRFWVAVPAATGVDVRLPLAA
jgi:hypothetical protein